MKEYLLDANVIVRFLVQDEPRQSAAATALFEKAERREIALHLDSLVLAETVYVLTGFYKRNRSDVANALLALIHNPGIKTDEETVIVDTLQRFGLENVDFADAWLSARSAKLDLAVASFDRDLDKFKDIQRFEPKS